ncbi:hypothetical protein EYF80_009295 [Liparis tanakae]|uniref:Uncharacterized protein n=1 Tax=Liparis tanakae TaxID=230148 RepID=A0A4Z2IRQ1_9TELE|nr:hypothetical protein EYF80_009295 [Liparis tanakae]
MTNFTHLISKIYPRGTSRNTKTNTFSNVTYEGLPAAAYTYHHMTLIQHLQRSALEKQVFCDLKV